MTCTEKELRSPAQFYNTMRHIDEQSFTVASSIFQELRQILVRHEVNDTFAIEILHRHLWLAPNSVMLHGRSNGEDYCQPVLATSADRIATYDPSRSAQIVVRTTQHSVVVGH
ncbi:hypothetical protein Z517_05427 [Fonsecaea pedrosoi CBS 271.37]|uniref:Uncharacterized protein n=1 Tax=Fonsecaea pedrosoi CBS 271.37 TaxID=1442368 RepID=A0A0D2GUV4_9EURO|nr:uncharacterized protein Z517_05427 [Fonsecaea pedrosoi CBS 271.37]KIW82400.1 hypothetical protein Z517_05427 [Fonsecaea pedrosoi CBS 271.37]